MPTLKKDGRNYTTNKENAELLGKYFSGVRSNSSHSVEFQELKSAFEDEHSEELHGGQLPADDQPFNEPFTITVLRIALSRCKKNTSPGEDTITSEILAQLPHPSLLALLEMFNRVWASGVLPDTWKNSIVVPILKLQKPAHEGNSYRPIALTSVLCKLIERLVTDRLTWHMEVNHLRKLVEKMFYATQFMKYNNDLKNTWLIIKTILKAKPRDHLINCPLVDGTEITTGSQIADKCNKYFTGIAQELVDKLPQPTSTTVNLGFPYPTSFAILPSSPEEVIEVGHLMKVTSSSGYDDIKPTLVGPLLHLVAEPLAVIFNSSFNTGI